VDYFRITQCPHDTRRRLYPNNDAFLVPALSIVAPSMAALADALAMAASPSLPRTNEAASNCLEYARAVLDTRVPSLQANTEALLPDVTATSKDILDGPSAFAAAALRRPLRRFVLQAADPRRAQLALADLGLWVAPSVWSSPAACDWLHAATEEHGTPQANAYNHHVRRHVSVVENVMAAAAPVLRATTEHPHFRAALDRADAALRRPDVVARAANIWTHLQTSTLAAMRHALHRRAGLTVDQAVRALAGMGASSKPNLNSGDASGDATRAIHATWAALLKPFSTTLATVTTAHAALVIAGVDTTDIKQDVAQMLLTAPQARIAAWLLSNEAASDVGVDADAMHYATVVSPSVALTVDCGACARAHA
jgi:hypothetical protein